MDESLLRRIEREGDKVDGISESGKAKLEALLGEFSDALKVKLGRGPAAIEFYDKCKPVRAAQRRYPPAKRQLLEIVTEKLVKIGFFSKPTEADWVAAPLVVLKAPPANFRLTILT